MTLSLVIQYLLAVLLIAGIAAVVKLFLVLNQVQTTLIAAQQEVNTTLVRVHAVTDSAERLMTEEVGPTLRALRANLENVEVTTRVLADTTQIVRQLSGRADNLLGGRPRSASVSDMVTQFVMQKATQLAGGLLTSVAGGVASLFIRKRKPKPPKESPSEQLVVVESSENRKNGTPKTSAAAKSGTSRT